MLKPTNDPLKVLRRDLADQERARRDAAISGGTQSYQAKRKLQDQIVELRELVLRLPQTEGRQVDEDGFVLTDNGAWKTLASTTIARPSNSTRVVVSTSSSITALALATTAGAVAFDTRIVVNGVISVIQPGMVEPPGAQYQRCSGYPSFVREISGLTSAVSVQVQARGFGYDAFAEQNRATLSVTAGFSTI